MPTHFKTLQEFRDLITKHNVRRVVVSQEDFSFLWEKVQPVSRMSAYKLTISNNQNDIVVVTRRLIGTLDLTEDVVNFVEDK